MKKNQENSSSTDYLKKFSYRSFKGELEPRRKRVFHLIGFEVAQTWRKSNFAKLLIVIILCINFLTIVIISTIIANFGFSDELIRDTLNGFISNYLGFGDGFILSSSEGMSFGININLGILLIAVFGIGGSALFADDISGKVIEIYLSRLQKKEYVMGKIGAIIVYINIFVMIPLLVMAIFFIQGLGMNPLEYLDLYGGLVLFSLLSSVILGLFILSLSISVEKRSYANLIFFLTLAVRFGKLDENGSEIWKTEIFGDFEDAIEPIILLNNDGNLYLTINENRGGLNVMKLNSLGDIVWNNTYTEKTVYTLHSSAVIDNNNSIYIVGIYKGGDGIFLKINSSGNLIFNNTYEEHFLQGIVLGENDSIYTIGMLNDGETDSKIEFIKWNSDGILLETIYWDISKPNFEVRSYLCDMQISEDNKIFALVGLFYSHPYQDQSEQDVIVWDLDAQTIQNKTIVNESEIDEIWLTSFLIDSENNLYTAGKANESVLLSKWDQSFNKIWQKTWNAESRFQLSYPSFENGRGMYLSISALLIVFYFVGLNFFMNEHRIHL